MIIPFNDSITQSALIDSIIIVSLGLITLYFLIQRKKILFILIGMAILEVFLYTQNEFAIELFALLMLPAIISIIIVDHFSNKKIIQKPKSWKNFLYTIIPILFSFELFVLIIWIAFALSPKEIVDSVLWEPVRLEYLTFYSMALLSPFVLLFASYWFVSKPAVATILDYFRISIKNTLEQKEITKTKLMITGFPSPTKSPQHYFDRYNNESVYKKWFDKRFSGLTIEQVVGYKETKIPNFPDLSKSPQYYVDRYNNEPNYKMWFDRNFSDKTIYDILGIDENEFTTETIKESVLIASKPAVAIIHDSFRNSIKKIQEQNITPNVVFSPKILLAVAIAISVVFAFYPYFPTLNPEYFWMSVDDHAYQVYITEIQSEKTTADLIKRTFIASGGDRPLTLLIMHSFHAISGLELVWAVRLFPIILGPGLVLSVYFLVNQGTKNKHTAAYAALLTVFSHQLIIGLYAGFFANWLGMIAAYLAFLMIHRYWENPNLKNYLLVFGHTIISFLMYVYVDVYVLLTLFFFLVITAIVFRSNSNERKKILFLSSIFGVYVAMFSIRVLLGSTELFDAVFAREDVALSITEFRNRWLNFPKFMHYYVGGFFANTALLAFTFLWAIYAKYENTFDRIILAALLAGAIPLVFGDFVLQSRIFFDMPIHIAAAIAIYRIVNTRGINSLFAKVAFSLITIHIAIYAIRSLSNLNLQGVI